MKRTESAADEDEVEAGRREEMGAVEEVGRGSRGIVATAVEAFRGVSRGERRWTEGTKRRGDFSLSDAVTNCQMGSIRKELLETASARVQATTGKRGGENTNYFHFHIDSHQP